MCLVNLVLCSMPILLSSVNVTTLKDVLAILNPHIYNFVGDETQTLKNTNEQHSDGKSYYLTYI